MAKRVLCLLVLGITCSSLATGGATAGRLSVEQLERALASAHGQEDSKVARQLSAVELTERLSSAKFKQLSVTLPGEKSREALLALADTSAFLRPPSAEIPATASPDDVTQRQMMALTVNYLAKTLPLLPNLLATRDIVRFETRPSSLNDSVDAERLLAVSRSSATVFYRDGHEFLSTGVAKTGEPRAPDKGLTTWGEFGPILGIVLIDAAKNTLGWSHWELGAAGPVAVFHYAVPVDRSHYEVRFCCVTQSYGLETNVLTQHVGYHGEISVDPASGTILRITIIADPAAGNPIAQADLVVEYGPVDLGGKTYFCPMRGIALARSSDLKSLSKSLSQLTDSSASGKQPAVQRTNLTALTNSAQQYLLNDITFQSFHLFRSEARIVTGAEAEAASKATPASSVQDASAFEAATPAAETASDAAAPPPPAAEPAPSSGSAPAAASAPIPAPLLPEISVVDAAGLPDSPAISASGDADSTATFRLNARLVDVSLVAVDKKGRPVTNLKPEDLEIFDNGNKVDLHDFSQAAAGAKSPQSGSPVQPAAASAESQFSNRRAAPVQSAGNGEDNSIVLLIDNNISFDDLSNVREQMGSFLKALNDKQTVALYVMRNGGFKVLHEATADHALLAATLARWTPSSDAIALGQEQEARNRQQMESVHNTEDLLSVNGRSNADTQAQTQGLDPQLRSLGDNPGAKALAGLILIARNLANIPGHKSLVWIASDNVLADWTNASLNIDKGDKFIEPAALRTQEAMNDAHVTVYPLDASRLEAGGLDASVADRNVGLNPTSTANQTGGCGLVTDGSRSGQAAGTDPALPAAGDINTCTNDLHPGRLTAQMHQDLHPIQGVYREIADATGGRTFRRSSDIVTELNNVVADGRATYLLSFTPHQGADDKYHLITIKLSGRKDVTLRYRTGYFYRQEASTIKDRFREIALQPEDATEIGLTANLVSKSSGHAVQLDIAGTDLALAQKEAFWTDKLDIFLVQTEGAANKAHVTGQAMVLRLQPASYQKYLREGIPFNQVLEPSPGINSMRIIVVDENSGRMGSITIPADALGKSS